MRKEISNLARHLLHFRTSIILWVLFSLTACNDEIGESLRRAAIKGQTEQVNALISAGADVNFKHGGWSVLMFAAREGHSKIAELLLAHGADPNAKGWKGETALTIAAEQGRVEVAKVLLSKGANVNDRTKNGDTSLMYSAQHGHPAITKLLLDSGADMKVKDADGDTALTLAKLKGREEIVQLLKQAGANE